MDIIYILIVYRIEFNKTRWSCPLNSDQTVQTLPGPGGVLVSGEVKGWWGCEVMGWGSSCGGIGVLGVMGC